MQKTRPDRRGLFRLPGNQPAQQLDWKCRNVMEPRMKATVSVVSRKHHFTQATYVGEKREQRSSQTKAAAHSLSWTCDNVSKRTISLSTCATPRHPEVLDLGPELSGSGEASDQAPTSSSFPPLRLSRTHVLQPASMAETATRKWNYFIILGFERLEFRLSACLLFWQQPRAAKPPP